MPVTSFAMISLTFATALTNAAAKEAFFHAIAQFPRLVLAGARAARDDGAAGPTAGKGNYGFDSWVTAGVEDLAAVNSDDLRNRHNRFFF